MSSNDTSDSGTILANPPAPFNAVLFLSNTAYAVSYSPFLFFTFLSTQ
jgi:hypothetical protein